MTKSSLYDDDFFAWASQQAALLRAGRLGAADIEHIAEEIESLGRTEKRELVSRLTVLQLYLLKWQYQPMMRGPSWRATFRVQRRDLEALLADNPSLVSKLPEAIARAYGNALIEAGAETGLPDPTFPADCPWSFDEMVDAGFWPSGESV